MANFNKIILAGNLTRDPQLSYTANNTAIAEFGMAVNRKWRGPDGQMKEDILFVDCKVFGKQAETFSQYMSKGRPVLIEGRLEFRQWQSQDGQKRSKHSVVVEGFTFLGGGGEGGGSGGGAPRRAPQQQAPRYPQQQPQQPPPTDDESPPADYDGGDDGSAPADDIPF